MKKRLALFNIVLLSGTIHAQGVVLNCQQDDGLLFPKQTLSTDDSLNVIADRSEITKKDQYLLTGNVSLNSSEYYLAADRINIKKSSKTSSATGNVKFQDRDLMMIADTAFVQKKDDSTYTTLERIKFHYPKLQINGGAKKITNNGVEQVFDSSTYSLCPLGNTDWRMKADKITLNTTTNQGIAEDVTVEFFGVPIFYSPSHTWVLEGRGSGFLAPNFGSYNDSSSSADSNYQVRIPYYFNIAPDRDFLLSLNQLSSRGSVLEGKYRQLITGGDNWDSGRFEAEGHYLYKDDITSQDRWLLNSKLDLTLNTRAKLSIVTNRVSDAQYFNEITHDNTSVSSLDSHANLSYDDEKRNLYFSVFSESKQLINSDSEAYTRAPEVLISKGIEALGNRNINLSILSTKFAHKNANTTTNKTGVRTHTQINFARTVSNNAYTLTPSLNIANTDYAMNGSANQNRNIAQFRLDSKLFLERETRLFDRDVIQTLTPRLAYNYTPKKDQSNLPIFDSETKSDSYEGLFSGQKFTGIDRINNANDITIGFESEFIDEETGETYLNLKAAQSFYNDNQVTSNTVGTDYDLREKYSNIFASANFTLNDYTFNNTFQYNPETSKLDKRDSAVTYLLSSRKFLTVAHHDDQGKKSVELYGAYPILNNVHIFAGINHSLTDSITNKETTGITYESCCWAVRLAHFKKHLSVNDYDYVTKFELVLKGLASSTPELARRLEKNIPNYLANLDD